MTNYWQRFVSLWPWMAERWSKAFQVTTALLEAEHAPLALYFHKSPYVLYDTSDATIDTLLTIAHACGVVVYFAPEYPGDGTMHWRGVWVNDAGRFQFTATEHTTERDAILAALVCALEEIMEKEQPK